MNKITFLKIFTTIFFTIVLFLPLNSVSALSFSPYFANASQQGACSGLQQLSATAGCNGTSSNKPITNIAQLVVNILSLIVGIAAVIMIIFAGFRYVTAGGDSNAINSARNILIYAIVGLFIAVLASLIASQVLNTASSVLKK